MDGGGWKFLAQRGNKFRREQISARLTGDEHERLGLHAPSLEQSCQRAKPEKRRPDEFLRLRMIVCARAPCSG
jgi:hypothetical protein